ncbi:MAG: NYN domain-containing protein [Candidatus Omnitrophica bacterium]|nr:NYN domain-containing protein [Candidatus Omnitrophota bacterium]
MSPHYIIDGYNIIKHPKFSVSHKDLNEGRRGLLNFIERHKLCGSQRNKVTVIFDGSGEVFSSKLSSSYEIIFTKNESADEKIKKLVSKAKNPKEMVVVSDDKEIIFFIRSRGARPLSVEEFIAKSKAPRKASSDLDEFKLSYSQMSKINEELRKIWLK